MGANPGGGIEGRSGLSKRGYINMVEGRKGK